MQVFITPDGKAMHMSKTFRRLTHDKKPYDGSGALEFVTERIRHGLGYHNAKHPMLTASG
jgi:hypothetical protein